MFRMLGSKTEVIDQNIDLELMMEETYKSK